MNKEKLKEDKMIKVEDEESNIVEFIKKSKFSIIIIVIFALFAFGQRLISSSFSIDTEFYIYNLNNTENWNWWIGLSRWGLVFLNKYFLQMGTLPIYASNFLTVLFMIMYSIAYNYLFYTLISEKYKKAYLKYQFIFPIIFITSPIFAEQYNFVIQNAGVALAILIIPVSILLIHKAMQEKNKIKKVLLYIFAICISILAFGVYQSIILLYIVSVVVCYLLKVIKENDNNWIYLFKQIGIFIVIAGAWLVISKILGQNTTYLQSAWLSSGIVQCICNIKECVKNVLLCDSMFYNIGYIVAILSSIIAFIYLAIKRKLKIGMIIGIVALLMSPFYVMIVTGVDQLKRTQFNYSFTVGIIIMLAVVFLSQKEKLKYVTVVGVIFAVGLAYMQSYTTSTLFYTSDVVYESDKALSHKLVERIEEKEWYDSEKEYRLVFVGRYDNNLKNAYLQGEVIGDSFYNFEWRDVLGANNRTHAFLAILGYDFKMPPLEKIEQAKEYVEENNTKAWPSTEAIQLLDEDTIVVRLSEEIR